MPADASPPSRARALATHILFSGGIAAEAVAHNKLRASLTSLGILFGVASVIAMLAIGNGAEREILEQMKLLGANNVVITPLVEQKEGKIEKDDGKKQSKKFTPGLTYLDAVAIKSAIPAVGATSSEVVVNGVISRQGHHRSGKVVGVDPSYFDVMNLHLGRGANFSPVHFSGAAPVAIIGQGVKSRFFTTEDPIGGSVKVGTRRRRAARARPGRGGAAPTHHVPGGRAAHDRRARGDPVGAGGPRRRRARSAPERQRDPAE